MSLNPVRKGRRGKKRSMLERRRGVLEEGDVGRRRRKKAEVTLFSICSREGEVC